MIKKWSIEITIYSVSDVIRDNLFEILIKISGI